MKEKSNMYLYLRSRFNRLARVSLGQQREQAKTSTQLVGDAARATRPRLPDTASVNLLRRDLRHMFYTSTSLFIASFSASGGIIDLRAR